MKGTKNIKLTVLAANIVAIIVLCAILIGSTFAWFTDSVASANNLISSGNLDIEFEYWDGDEWIDVNEKTDILTNELWEPGVTEVAYLKVKNAGSLALKYQLGINIVSETAGVNVAGETFKLSDYIMFGVVEDVNGETDAYAAREDAIADIDNAQKISAGYGKADYMLANEELYLALTVYMPTTVGNEANHNGTDVPTIDLGLSVKAAQVSSEEDGFDNGYDDDAEYPSTTDAWDGTVDTSWYNETDTSFGITTAEQLAGLAALVDNGNTFAGKTIKLKSNVDLYLLENGDSRSTASAGTRVCFEPIGDSSNDFSGIFDGTGKTIFNLYQDCNAQHVALFGAVYDGAVKNLILDGARIENDGSGYAAGIAAYAGASAFENITLRNCTVVNCDHNTAGIVGWCSNNGTTTTFDGINIESTTTIGSWWGSPDTRVGGIVGAMNTGNYVVIKNSTVACRLDVYNDVVANYQWGNYRMAGMVVGDVRDNQTIDGRTQADPVRVTCENVTVIFGDWVNYHYCEDSSYGTPSYADPGEYKFRRVESGLGYGGIDISACDHAEDETHNELIAFDFLFGARDGKGVYGISSFEGVTVIHS